MVLLLFYQPFPDLEVFQLNSFLLPLTPGGQDGVVVLPGATHLDVLEARGPEQVGVLGRRTLAPLRLHQHVEGEDLSHDGASPVLEQHGLHQQDAAAWSAGVVDFLQQSQALLLGPVVNDSGQNIQVGSRDFTAEEITCMQKSRKNAKNRAFVLR